MSIYWAVKVKENVLLGIVKLYSGYDVSLYIFIVVLVIGVIILFFMLWIWCVSYCYYSCCHWLMAIWLTCYSLIFLAGGSGLLYVVDFLDGILKDSWNNSNDSLAKVFSELYTKADDYYCRSSNGCYCRTKGAVSSSNRTYYTTTNATSTTIVTKFQDCTYYLSYAFGNYTSSLSSTSKIIEYLDYFGSIEQAYSCSGMCNITLPVYYFSDSYSSYPTKVCMDSIRENLLKGEIKFYGGSFVAIGSVMFLIWLIQYGLCCRKTPPGQGTQRF